MTTVPIALYDAFTGVAFGGSQGAVAIDDIGIDKPTMAKIAKEIGAPATCFVTKSTPNSITARFMSTVMELPMCGHGTICLMTRMIEIGILSLPSTGKLDVVLRLPSTTASVELSKREDGRPQVMLDIQPPTFRQDNVDTQVLASLLGIDTNGFDDQLPIETAAGDFVHLVVPITDLKTMAKITPNFSGIIDLCHKHNIETVAVFCTEVEQTGYTIHVRDFCPAVGVAESAAAGTTNGALTSYLIRHNLVKQNSAGVINVKAEQGHEINRPSTIQSAVTMINDKISRLQVGGVATKIMDGQIYLPA